MTMVTWSRLESYLGVVGGVVVEFGVHDDVYLGVGRGVVVENGVHDNGPLELRPSAHLSI